MHTEAVLPNFSHLFCSSSPQSLTNTFSIPTITSEIIDYEPENHCIEQTIAYETAFVFWAVDNLTKMGCVAGFTRSRVAFKALLAY